jgi:hypothetical protein
VVGFGMSLGDKQERFAWLVSALITKAHSLGFEVRLQELARTEYQAKENARLGVGVEKSAHINKLAIDIVLTQHETILEDTASYQELGEWWCDQDPDCRWGGDWDDGGHFSVEHWGMA